LDKLEIVGSLLLLASVIQWALGATFRPSNPFLQPKEDSPVNFWLSVVGSAVIGIILLFVGLTK